MTSTTIFIIAAAIIAVLVIIFLIAAVKRRGSSQSDDINNQIYVGNIPYRVKDYELKKFFSHFGAIRQARIVRNSRTGRSKGFAFVTFNRSQDAQKALDAHGQEMQGRTMVVRIAKPPRERVE